MHVDDRVDRVLDGRVFDTHSGQGGISAKDPRVREGEKGDENCEFHQHTGHNWRLICADCAATVQISKQSSSRREGEEEERRGEV